MPINAMIIVDDNVGEGQALAFPKMSTCIAVVAVLHDRLAGGHFTVHGSYTPVGQIPRSTQMNFANMGELINNDPVQMLFIVGFTQNHDPNVIRNGLNCGNGTGIPVLAYDIARKDVDELMLIFTHAGGGNRPAIEFKRSSKATSQMNPQQPLDRVHFGRMGTVTADHRHLLRRHFTQL